MGQSYNRDTGRRGKHEYGRYWKTAKDHKLGENIGSTSGNAIGISKVIVRVNCKFCGHHKALRFPNGLRCSRCKENLG